MEKSQSLAYTPDSPIVWRADSSALEIADIGGTIKVWDLATRQFVKLTKLNTPPFSLGAWSPQHDRLALTNGDQAIRLIDVNQKPEAMVLKTGASEVFSVAWSRDGQRLATTGNNIKIWDTAGRQVQTLAWQDGWIVIASAWSPDGRRLASSSLKQAGGTIKISDTASGKELFVWNAHIGAAFSVAWNADGTRLATGGTEPAWSRSGTPVSAIRKSQPLKGTWAWCIQSHGSRTGRGLLRRERTAPYGSGKWTAKYRQWFWVTKQEESARSPGVPTAGNSPPPRPTQSLSGTRRRNNRSRIFAATQAPSPPSPGGRT